MSEFSIVDLKNMRSSTSRLTTRKLMDELGHLHAKKPISLQVLSEIEKPESSASDLAAIIAADVALSARLLRMANSAYYGLSGKVSTLQFAVTVLGFSTVRTVALADAVGIHDPQAAPIGFWEDAAITGVAASRAAKWTGASAPEALCAGLLHDLGKVLIYRTDTDNYQELLSRDLDSVSLIEAERKIYGLDHCEVGARALEAWSLPSDIVNAVRNHHEMLSLLSSPLERTLSLGLVFVDTLKGDVTDPALLKEASAGRLSVEQAKSIVEDMKDEAAVLTSALEGS